MKPAIWVALACVTASPAFAQAYYDWGGTPVSGVVAIPYSMLPVPPGQHNLAPTAVTGLMIPIGSRFANICASGATVKHTTDGVTTPAANIGQPLAQGACVLLAGAQALQNFRAISTSATGTLDVEYFK